MADAVSLEILIETKEALKRLESFEKEAASSTKSIEKSFDSLKTVAEAAIAFLALDKIKDFFADSINAAAEQEKGLARLANAMALTGEYSKAAAADFEEFAHTMQKTTKFGDDAVISQLSVAKSFGLTNDKAKELVKTAADLAAATGESLETAVHQLGITYSGTAGRLGQTIPILKGLTEEQLKAGEAVKLLSDRFGGSAAAEINTYGGAVQQSSNAFEDFQKAIGRVVTESPTVIARIQGMTKMWENLEKFVSDNKKQLGEFVDFGIKALATAGPVAVAVLRGLITAFQALVGTTELVISGFLELQTFLANGLKNTFGTIVDAVLSTASTLIEFADKIPGASDALKKMGVDTDDLSKTIDRLKTSFDETTSSAVKGIEGARDEMVNFTVKTDTAFKSFDVGFEKFSKAVDGGAQAIFNAGENAQGAIDKVKNSAAGLGAVAGPTAAEMKKLREEFEKFEKGLYASQADPAKKAAEEFQNAVDTIDKAIQQGVVSFQKGEEDKTIAASTFADKMIKINEDIAKKAEEAAAKQRAAMQSLTQNPFGDGTDAGDGAGLSRGIGFGTQLLNGKAGATQLVSQGIGAAGDALGIPGLGQVAQLLAAGPEQTKAMVKAFVEALPDIIQAIAESIPVVVEVFVDTMVNKGGAVKIGLAIIKAMSGEAILKSIGKQMGISFGDSLNGPNFGKTVSGWFKDAIAEFHKFPAAFSEAISSGLDGLQSAGDSIRLAAANMPGQISEGFKQGGATAAASIGSAFDEAGGKIKAAIDKTFEPIRDFFKNLSFPEIVIPTPPWLDTFIKALNSATGKGNGGGKGLIGEGADNVTDVFTGKKKLFARGITEIPGGFPNDSLIAGLSTGERVVDADTNSDLKSFLKQGGTTDALLGKVIALLERPMQVTASAKLDNRTLADIILNLNRTNQRLA